MWLLEPGLLIASSLCSLQHLLKPVRCRSILHGNLIGQNVDASVYVLSGFGVRVGGLRSPVRPTADRTHGRPRNAYVVAARPALLTPLEQRPPTTRTNSHFDAGLHW